VSTFDMLRIRASSSDSLASSLLLFSASEAECVLVIAPCCGAAGVGVPSGVPPDRLPEDTVGDSPKKKR